jgi:hypothetical protein
MFDERVLQFHGKDHSEDVIAIQWRSDKLPTGWKPPIHFFYATMLAVREEGEREHIEYVAAQTPQALALAVRSVLEAGLDDYGMLYMALVPVDLPTNRAELFNMKAMAFIAMDVDVRLWWGDTEATYYGTLENICELVETLMLLPHGPYIHHSSHLFGIMHPGTANS